MSDKRQELLKQLRSILEADESFGEQSRLDCWDSLAWVQCLSVIDEIYGRTCDPTKLKACYSAKDVLDLAEAE